MMFTFFMALIVFSIANKIHGNMPFWYAVLCYVVVDIAVLANDHYWIQFELVSILGVTAMVRDLVKKGVL